MKRLRVLILAAVFCLCCGLAACSRGSNEEPDTGAIKELTDEVAHEAADAIQKPTNKARQLQRMTKEKEEAAEEVD